MITPVLLILSAVPGTTYQTPRQQLEGVAAVFLLGVHHRSDAAEARRYFRSAAKWCDELWATTLPIPAVARYRAASHFLAGHLPQALAAVHDGLRLAPYDVELQQDLLAIRGTIPYPEPADPAARVRPDPPGGLRSRATPWDAYRAAAVFGVVAAIGLAHRLTTRPAWSTPVAAVGLIGLAAAAGVAWHLAAAEPPPLVIVAADGVTLRTGNGEAYPPRVAEPLPRGAELRELGRRGGWVQVELPGGAAGWLPEAAILAAR